MERKIIKYATFFSNNRQYDNNDTRGRVAALKFNLDRNNKHCDAVTTDNSPLRIVKSDVLNRTATDEKNTVVCRDLSLMRVSSPYDTLCDYDVTPKTAVFVRKTMYAHELSNVQHAFVSLSSKFGGHGPLSDVFMLFEGTNDVLVSRDACSFVNIPDNADMILNEYDRFYSNGRLNC